MKNKLTSQIQEIAKKLLATQGDFDTKIVKQNIASLHDKLVILDHLETQLHQPSQPKEVTSMDSKSFREENWFKEPEQLPTSEHKEDLVEPVMEKIKDIVAQMPPESQEVDDFLSEILPKKQVMKNDIEAFAATYQETPTFERKVDEEKPASPNTEAPLEKRKPAKGVDAPQQKKELIKDKGISEKPRSINDAGNGSLKIGLNDRIAFIKHLFDGSADDYQRVLSQINTLENYDEAATFIKGKVKPDYNYWLGKDEVTERFMNLIEKRFN